MLSRSVALTFALMLSGATEFAQVPGTIKPRPPQTYQAFLQGQYASVKRYIIGSAEKMPAEHYGFKPVQK